MSKELIHATKTNDVQEVKRLINVGADVNYKTRYRYTALHFAALHENKELVEFLLNHGADSTIESCFNETAFDVAKSWGYKDIANLLKNHTTCINSNIAQNQKEESDWRKDYQRWIDNGRR